ncbi:hypothetical protein GWI33_022283 [Rhynchophorus ferrugineus]|uniref:Uncharacterized protein n=1 Tax=Rhynchophorus ferrugineus TaxID=354439 RepID=A0A834MJ49_RHYFE|nr:hypothetical protein GWI33_022283 [Rhynchophorus ferrugineus]
MTVLCSYRNNVSRNRCILQTAARMGCGHSKINIYPRKSKTKQSSSKKSVTPEKAESEEEDGIDNETEYKENLDDCDKKTVKIKPFGGPLLAQTEISTSQQDFFKMLDEKIENGPDYNSESESEKIAERVRLRDLIKEWETASTNSGSQSGTPKKSPSRREGSRKSDGVVPAREMTRVVNDAKGYIVQVSQNVIHQSYGIPPHQEQPVQQIAYRQVNYTNPAYPNQSPQHGPCLPAAYPNALQYQAIIPMYNQPAPPLPLSKQYMNYNNYGNVVKSFPSTATVFGSPKHYHHTPPPYDQPVTYSPAVGLKVNPAAKESSLYSNGELMNQQRNQQMHYQQYKGSIGASQHSSQPGPYEPCPRNYQSSVPSMSLMSKSTDVVQKHYELA